MAYSQLLYRIVAFAIAVAASWLLATDRLCMLSTIDGCRPVHGPAAVALFLAALGIAAFLMVASTQPRRGQRTRDLIVALVAFLVCRARMKRLLQVSAPAKPVVGCSPDIAMRGFCVPVQVWRSLRLYALSSMPELLWIAAWRRV
jgi:hypothetical protein